MTAEITKFRQTNDSKQYIEITLVLRLGSILSLCNVSVIISYRNQFGVSGSFLLMLPVYVGTRRLSRDFKSSRTTKPGDVFLHHVSQLLTYYLLGSYHETSNHIKF